MIIYHQLLSQENILQLDISYEFHHLLNKSSCGGPVDLLPVPLVSYPFHLLFESLLNPCPLLYVLGLFLGLHILGIFAPRMLMLYQKALNTLSQACQLLVGHSQIL